MDKEIIIDGVDVAECGYFCEADNECSICGMGTDGEDTFCKNCKDNPNCYHKQLKRLEQENEQLKKENKVNLSRSLDLNREIQNLSDENAELKAENARKKDMIERQWKLLEQCGVHAGGELRRVSYLLENLRKENAELKGENERLQKLTCFNCGEETMSPTGAEIYDKILVYKQTLQEIKAIAEAPKPFIDFSGIKTLTEIEYDYAAICNELELRLHKALELITKAEEE